MIGTISPMGISLIKAKRQAIKKKRKEKKIRELKHFYVFKSMGTRRAVELLLLMVDGILCEVSPYDLKLARKTPNK